MELSKKLSIAFTSLVVLLGSTNVQSSADSTDKCVWPKTLSTNSKDSCIKACKHKDLVWYGKYSQEYKGHTWAYNNRIKCCCLPKFLPNSAFNVNNEYELTILKNKKGKKGVEEIDGQYESSCSIQAKGVWRKEEFPQRPCMYPEGGKVPWKLKWGKKSRIHIHVPHIHVPHL